MRFFFFMIFSFVCVSSAYAEPPFLDSAELWQVISFFVGALTGIAFVIASAMRW